MSDSCSKVTGFCFVVTDELPPPVEKLTFSAQFKPPYSAGFANSAPSLFFLLSLNAVLPALNPLAFGLKEGYG